METYKDINNEPNPQYSEELEDRVPPLAKNKESELPNSTSTKSSKKKQEGTENKVYIAGIPIDFIEGKNFPLKIEK